MSWIYVPALEAWPLASSGPGSPPAATSRRTLGVNASSQPECATAHSDPLLCGTTSEPLTGSLGVDAWISWLQDSHANPIAWRESAEDLMTIETSGPTSSGSFAKFDPDTSSWRTYQESLAFSEGDSSGEFLETWPPAGCMSNGKAFPLPPLAPRTSGIASGLWPTPAANGNHNRAGLSATSGDGLSTAFKAAGGRFPTPSARDWKSSHASEETLSANSRPLNEVVSGGSGGQLNPMWVGWLQGYPLGWTSFEDTGTASSRRSRNTSPPVSSATPEESGP